MKLFILTIKRHVMCKSLLYIFPLLTLTVIICSSYYTYVILYCLFSIESYFKKVIYIVAYHILLVMVLWSFFKTMLCNHELIPSEYRLSPQEHDRLLTFKEEESNAILKKLIHLRNLEIQTCSVHDQVRYCRNCFLIKPDRTHHCSLCEKCIMKMDHHCPWVHNCVGFSNYKHFILLLFYTTVLSVFIVGTEAEQVEDIARNFSEDTNKMQLGIGFLVCTFTGVFTCILFVYHLNLMFRNETTLEALREPRFLEGNLTFNVGVWRNFVQVFGENCCMWCLPILPELGNGYEFPTKNLIDRV